MGQDTELICKDCKVVTDTGRNHNQASQMQSFLLAHAGHNIMSSTEYMDGYDEADDGCMLVVYPVTDSYEETVCKWVDNE
jgi:hypothetical protein